VEAAKLYIMVTLKVTLQLNGMPIKEFPGPPSVSLSFLINSWDKICLGI
jgi:hypothetical protein